MLKDGNQVMGPIDHSIINHFNYKEIKTYFGNITINTIF